MNISHITVPNSILLRFKNVDNTVTAYDFDANQIREVDIYRGQRKDTINYEVEEGYYSELVEKYFGKYECDLGNLYKNISDFRNVIFRGNTQKELRIEEYRELVITAIALGNIRKPEFLKEMLWNKSLTNLEGLISFEDYKNKYVYTTKTFESIIEKYKILLKDYKISISIIDSTCENSFVLTRDLVQSFGKTFYLVLSPRISVILYPIEEEKKFTINHNYKNYEIIKSDEQLQIFTQNLINNMKQRTIGTKEVIGLKNQLELVKKLAEDS